jgi:putative ABC transport system substrate-binding protein
MFLVFVQKLVIIAAQLLVLIAFGASANLVVIYPAVPPPYDRVFTEIINGITDEYSGKFELKAINKKSPSNEVIEWINQQETDMLITLGKRGYQIAKQMDQSFPIVAGALPIKPNGVSGISLVADPKVLFKALTQLAPNIKRIKVVYSSNSEWLIVLAEQQAAEFGLNLSMIKADSVKDALRLYDEILRSIDTKTEALWLPLDPITANEQVILPNLLERSWEQNLVLFSSKPAHAKRGALFSMFPDHNELGRQLVVMVESMYESKLQQGVLPMHDMKLAVNLRTAAHLGFEYKNRVKNTFHLTFPQ